MIDDCGPVHGVDFDVNQAVDHFQAAVEGLVNIDVTSIVDFLTGDGIFFNVVHDPNNPIMPASTSPDSVLNNGAAYRSNEHPDTGSRPKLTIDFTAGGPPPGDATGDGIVDVADLGIVGANFGCTDCTAAEGDFTGDGNVDVADLGILGANWSAAQAAGSAAALVPEPATAGLVLAGLPLLLRRRR